MSDWDALGRWFFGRLDMAVANVAIARHRQRQASLVTAHMLLVDGGRMLIRGWRVASANHHRVRTAPASIPLPATRARIARMGALRVAAEIYLFTGSDG